MKSCGAGRCVLVCGKDGGGWGGWEAEMLCGVCAVAQVLLSATEAAEMILRVDDIIRCAPRQRQG